LPDITMINVVYRRPSSLSYQFHLTKEAAHA
jgi:hypothetical protein